MNYNDISILNFQRLHSAYRLHGENVYEIGMEILNIFEGMDRATSSAMSVKAFNKLMRKYAFLNEDLPSDNWVKEFELNGVKYKVLQTPDKWNVGQYVSITNLTKNNEAIIDNLHLILAVMCEGDNLDVKERAELFQDKLTIDIAYPIALFFCGVMLMLPKDIQHSLKAEG